MSGPTLPYYTREAILAMAHRDYKTELVQVLRVEPGHGRHVHTPDCKGGGAFDLAGPGRCLKHCDDSDLIVEIEYGSNGWHAVYGVIDGQPVLWMD